MLASLSFRGARAARSLPRATSLLRFQSTAQTPDIDVGSSAATAVQL